MLKPLLNNQFDAIFSIMEDSFPSDELRTYEGQKALLNRDCYRILIHEINGQIAAFFALWDLEHCIFMEHFAVDSAFRNRGLGGILLKELLPTLEKPLVIEVEHPTTPIAKSRIGFYERHGFVLNPYDYVQSALSQGKNPLPLLIMSYPTAITPAQFADFETAAKTIVYGRLSNPSSLSF